MSQLPSRAVYATEEDLALRAGSDFGLICTADQLLAAESDGAFLVSDRWILHSASGNFLNAGIRPGHVIQLLKPTTHFRSSGTLLAVHAVAAQSLTLRRLGQVAGTGQPPGPASGLTGIEFRIPSLGPQLERASHDLDRRLGIDPLVPGRSSADVRDVTPLRDAVVLIVLVQRLLAAGKTGNSSEPESARYRCYQKELDERLARLALGWTRGDGPVTRFSTRLVR